MSVKNDNERTVPSGRLAAVSRKRNEISKLIEDDPSFNRIKIISLYGEYLEKVETLLSTCNTIIEGLDGDGQEEIKAWLEPHNKAISEFRTFVECTIKNTTVDQAGATALPPGNISIPPIKLGSECSFGSFKSNTSSARVRLAERKAKLAAEKKYEEKKFELKQNEEINKMKMKKVTFEQEQLEHEILEHELNKIDDIADTFDEQTYIGAKPKKKLFNQETNNDQEKISNQNPNLTRNTFTFNRKNLCSTNDSYFQAKEEDDSKKYSSVINKDSGVNDLKDFLNKQNKMSEALLRVQERSSLPKKELQIFDGRDISKYRPFIHMFFHVIDRICDSDAERLYYLQQYTAEGPHELVKSIGNLNPSDAYKEALNLLEEEYGDEYKLASAHIQKLQRWPTIKSEDGAALSELSLFLMTIRTNMSNMSTLNQLNGPQEIMKVIMKLPFELRRKWRQLTMDLIDGKSPVRFTELVSFVRYEAKKLNQPLFGNIKGDEEKRKQRVFATKEENGITNSSKYESGVSNDNINYCKYCDKTNHDITVCKFYENLSSDEKFRIIREFRLCFCCLREGHFSKMCNSERTCEVCHKRHPTVLHKENENTNQNESKNLLTRSSSFVTGAGNAQKIACSIIPVKVKVKGKSELIKTYATLDTCSTSCFISEKLLDRLGMTGKDETLNIATMIKRNSKTPVKVINNLELYDMKGDKQDTVPVVYAQAHWPFDEEDVPSKVEIRNMQHLKNIPFDYFDSNVELLIGMNRAEMVKPLRIVEGSGNSCYATLHKLGWAINGPVSNRGNYTHKNHRITVSKNIDMTGIETEIKQMYNEDYKDTDVTAIQMSESDKRWKQLIENSISLKDGHYEIALPFKKDNMKFPCNRTFIQNSFLSLLNKFKRDEIYFNDYKNFMNIMIEEGFMERVPDEELNLSPGDVWYLSHHGIYHKQKKKLRVVFNCALKHHGNRGTCLNDQLLQGPDLVNSLLGVILRFRQNKIAFMADIRKMFYQVRVPTSQRNFLRFFWMENSDLRSKLTEFRLTVHLFGAVSSPSICNFALKQTIFDNPILATDEIKQAIERNFYVDDLLCSVKTVTEGLGLFNGVKGVIANGGFELTEFVGNSVSMLASINTENISNNFEHSNLSNGKLLSNRALGLVWNIAEDTLSCKINVEQKFEVNRRNILSIIHSIYDPLGVLGPVMVPAKRIFQETCKKGCDWSEELPSEIKAKWLTWMEGLQTLSNFSISRCIKPNETVSCEIHYFCDGSELAYGSVAYLRCILPNNFFQVTLLMAKSRLTPFSNTALKTIPRIELNAAKLSILLHQILIQELDIRIDREVYWTDSLTVLSYIKNDERRFHRFVANRVSFIRSNSSVNQWRHVSGLQNPADVLSRGTGSSSFVRDKAWKVGPNFLNMDEATWPTIVESFAISEEDTEIKCSVIKAGNVSYDPIHKLMNSCSHLYKLKCRVAWLKRFICFLQKNVQMSKCHLTLEEHQNAEIIIYKYLQREAFGCTIQLLSKKKQLPRNNNLLKLCPYLHDGVMRVGGRLQCSSESYSFRHPIILPNNHLITKLIVEETHKLCGHLGRESMISKLRERFWILGINSLVKKILYECLSCRKLKMNPGNQIMAPLPSDRVNTNHAPFNSTGIDFFGPYSVVNGRKCEKRYGVLFTCVASRAMHIEMAYALTTDSFLNSFRKFLTRRGNVKIVRTDNATNFVGGHKELTKFLNEWNEHQISSWMIQRNIDWKFNPPSGPHFGGIWEREIKTIKQVLTSILNEQPLKLSDESLSTLFCEVESILNSRPLTELSNDPEDMECLTPNHLLVMRGSTFPPGLFNKEDLYSTKRWKQIQYLSDLFWTRWRKQYLPLLQLRQKWQYKRRSFNIGDLVLLVDQLLPRNQWSTGRIVKVYPDKNGDVRIVRVKVAKVNDKRSSNCETMELDRPIAKLILLMNKQE